jgi:ATP-dependent DNA helicase DinG
VLPPYDSVIFDEAHQLETIAAEFFGLQVGSARCERLSQDAERTARAEGVWNDTTARAVTLLTAAQADLFNRLRGDSERRRPIAPEELLGQERARLERLDEALGDLASEMGREDEERSEALMQLERRATQLRRDLRALLAGLAGAAANVTEDGYAAAPTSSYWVDVAGHFTTLGSTPIQVGDILRAKLWHRGLGVVLTSATLGSTAQVATREDGSAQAFGYLRGRLGVDDAAAELCVESPFDYATRALLYTPRDVPDVNDPSFDEIAVSRVLELDALTGGGAFVLATSRRQVEAVGAALKKVHGARVLVQGEGTKNQILEKFRAHGSALLVATMSFWEGVDVVGDALRLVVVLRLPFPVPTDPLVAARSLVIEQGGGNAFMQLHVPHAAITLRQGFGRLIRSERDRGVVAILDKRITTKPYGRRLLAALPALPRIFDGEELASKYRKLFAV